jgi:hypothetical protein
LAFERLAALFCPVAGLFERRGRVAAEVQATTTLFERIMKRPRLAAGRGNSDCEPTIVAVRLEMLFGLVALGLQGV